MAAMTNKKTRRKSGPIGTVIKGSAKALKGAGEYLDRDVLGKMIKSNPLGVKDFYSFGYAAGQQDRKSGDVGLYIDPMVEEQKRFNFIWERALDNREVLPSKKQALKTRFSYGYNDAYARRAKRKGNPESESAEMYEAFHGSPSKSIVTVIDEEHYHSNLAACGALIGIKFRTPNGDDYSLEFDGVLLTMNEKGTSLYIEDGDQSVDLKAIHMDEFKGKDTIILGEAWCIGYHTQKDFDDHEPTDYIHGFGPEKLQAKLPKGADLWEDAEPPKEQAFNCGELPTLRYDTLNKKLFLDGGTYKIDKPLIGTSPGIEG